MRGQLSQEYMQVDAMVRDAPNSEPAFVRVISTVLMTQHERSHEIVERCLERLRAKDFELYRGLVVEPSRFSSILRVCSSVQHLAVLMKEHHDYMERSGYDYGEKVFQLVCSQLESIMAAFPNERSRLFLTHFVDEFYTFKKMDGKATKWTRIDELAKLDIDRRILSIAEYVINPLLANFGSKCAYRQQLQPILIKWLLFLPVTSDLAQNRLILELSRRIVSLASPMQEVTPILAETVSLLLNFCEVEYNERELVDCSANVGLVLNQIKSSIIPELTNSWMKGLKSARPSTFVNVCSNLAGACVSPNTLRIIQIISYRLKEDCAFEALEGIYDKVVKHRLARCNFKREGTLLIFLDIVTFYVVGFINSQRLDDELDALVLHYKHSLLHLRREQLETASYKMELLLTVCQCRFNNLTNRARNAARELAKVFKKTPSSLLVADHIAHNQFPLDFGVPQGGGFLLQASRRYVGLANIGNTCYFNSFLQALYMTRSFRTLVDELPAQVASSQPSIIVKELFQELTKRAAEIHPYKFKSVLNEPFRSSREQHDSAEFGRSLLEQLSADFANTPFEERLSDIFETRINTIRCCKVCAQGKNRIELHKQIILPTVASEPIYVSKSLTKMFTMETLGGEDRVLCGGKCQKKQEVTLKMLPERFSSCLSFCLNRFEFDKAQQQYVKKLNPVAFEFQLQLKTLIPNIDGSDTIYDLYAFIVHIGTVPSGGHYITYARNTEENPNIWYTFDDSYVTEKEVTHFDDFNLGEFDTPYLLFYCSQTNKPVDGRSINKIRQKDSRPN